MLRLWQAIKQYKDGHQPLYHLGIIILFWALADGITTFVLPVYMEQVFNDLFLVGLIFSSSSVFGIFADIVFGSEQKDRSFKPYFIGSILLAVVAYIISFKANSWPIFVLIMALWGIYFEAFNFGIIDFLSHFSKKQEHSQSSGVVQMFYSFGLLVAPIIAGQMVLKNRGAMLAAIMFMCLAGLAFSWWFIAEKTKSEPIEPQKKLSFTKELQVWWQVSVRAKWALTGLFLINFWDSLIWSMGAIFLLDRFGVKAAYIMACFVIPRVFLQGYAGHWADKKGKKQFLVIGLVIAGVFLALFSYGNSLIVKVLTALGSAIGAALVWPAGDGLFIDMIDGYKRQEEEVAGVRGLAHNLAYIIGPLAAGFLAKSIGLPITFLSYGIFLVIGGIFIKLCWK